MRSTVHPLSHTPAFPIFGVQSANKVFALRRHQLSLSANQGYACWFHWFGYWGLQKLCVHMCDACLPSHRLRPLCSLTKSYNKSTGSQVSHWSALASKVVHGYACACLRSACIAPSALLLLHVVPCLAMICIEQTAARAKEYR